MKRIKYTKRANHLEGTTAKRCNARNEPRPQFLELLYGLQKDPFFFEVMLATMTRAKLFPHVKSEGRHAHPVLLLGTSSSKTYKFRVQL